MSFAEDNQLDTFDGDDIRYYADEEVEYISLPAWRTKEDTLILIQDMDSSHIRHCINMIHRSNDTWRPQYLPHFEAELHRREFLPDPPKVVYIV